MIDQRTYEGPTIGELIIISLRKFRDRDAFKDAGRVVTFREMELLIARAAARLEALGVKRGAAVVQIASNAIEVFAVTAACYIQGYRSVTLQPTLSIEDQEHIVRDSEAVVVLVDNEGLENGARLKDAVGSYLRVNSHQSGNDTIPAFWVADAKSKMPLETTVRPGDPVRQSYTGGTTGSPKGVIASSHSLACSAMNFMATQSWEREIKYLCASPMSHASGTIILPVFLKGGCTILHKKFNAGEVIRAIDQEGITSTFLVPTMIYSLLEHPKISSANLKSIRRIIYGAAPISASRLREALEVFGPVFIQIYGQTEAPCTILTLDQNDHVTGNEKLLLSAGVPYPGVHVKLLDDDCVPVPRGEIGEICVRGPLIMSGYWKKPELTAETLRGGWLHTGDLAYQDEQGYVFIVDRKKDMIISGGFNVYPKEVENALLSHPAVASAAVIGIPDERWGEAVKAVVVLQRGEVISPQELITFVKSLKGSVQAPKSIDLVDDLPLTNLGKIDKNALRAPYWREASRRING